MRPAMVALVAAIGVTAGCGTGAPASASETIGAAGGSVVLRSGSAQGATVSVPAAALEGDVVITVAQGPAITDLAVGARVVGPTVVLGPEGQQFAVPVTITIPTVSLATTLYTRPRGGSVWSVVSGATYDDARHVMVAQVAHFSEFVAAAADGDGGTLDVYEAGSGDAGPDVGPETGPNQDAGADARPCVPQSCAQLGRNCGAVGDGCGGILNCGTCVQPQTCGGGGTPGRCGAACTPRTCAQRGIGCGVAGNGCGGTIDCGSCPTGQTCGGGGPSRCG